MRRSDRQLIMIRDSTCRNTVGIENKINKDVDIEKKIGNKEFMILKSLAAKTQVLLEEIF